MSSKYIGLQNCKIHKPYLCNIKQRLIDIWSNLCTKIILEWSARFLISSNYRHENLSLGFKYLCTSATPRLSALFYFFILFIYISSAATKQTGYLFLSFPNQKIARYKKFGVFAWPKLNISKIYDLQLSTLANLANLFSSWYLQKKCESRISYNSIFAWSNS